MSSLATYFCFAFLRGEGYFCMTCFFLPHPRRVHELSKREKKKKASSSA